MELPNEAELNKFRLKIQQQIPSDYESQALIVNLIELEEGQIADNLHGRPAVIIKGPHSELDSLIEITGSRVTYIGYLALVPLEAKDSSS